MVPRREREARGALRRLERKKRTKTKGAVVPEANRVIRYYKSVDTRWVNRDPSGKVYRRNVRALLLFDILLGKTGGLMELSRAVKPRSSQTRTPASEGAEEHFSFDFRTLPARNVPQPLRGWSIFFYSGGCHPRLSSFEPSARSISIIKLSAE